MTLFIFKILNNFKGNKKLSKFFYFIIITIIFAFVYCFFPNDEFGGINEIQLLLDPHKIDKTSKILNKQNKIKDTMDIAQIKAILNKFFLRIYYSFTVVSTVGFGDIYPASIRLKAITMIQFLCIIYVVI